jgi:hypothetical protein
MQAIAKYFGNMFSAFYQQASKTAAFTPPIAAVVPPRGT